MRSKKHLPVIVSYSLPGQPGVERCKEVIMSPGTKPEVCAKRAIEEYRKTHTKGKRNITYYCIIKPEDTKKF